MSILQRLSGSRRQRPGGVPLELVRGPKRWPLDRRPLALGRAPESDIVIPGDTVSRLHAWIVPTADGALLLDQSRLGTSVNDERLEAPWLLRPGDTITIADIRYEVHQSRREPTAGDLSRSGAGGRVRTWLRRYGPSELLGTVAAVGVAVGVQDLTGRTVVAAYAGAVAENIVFYGIMFLRESVREAHQAGVKGRPFDSADLLPVLRNLILEFGVAEMFDTLLIRPLLMGLGLRYIGGNLGGLAGKLSADLVFYGPVLAMYEWRLARSQARKTVDRGRRTTAVGLTAPGAETD